MRVNSGLPRETYAVRPDGSMRLYESMTKAAKSEGYTPQYVHRDLGRDVLRKYQSKDPIKRGVRFCGDRVFAKILADRNKEYYQKYMEEQQCKRTSTQMK